MIEIRVAISPSPPQNKIRQPDAIRRKSNDEYTNKCCEKERKKREYPRATPRSRSQEERIVGLAILLESIPLAWPR